MRLLRMGFGLVCILAISAAASGVQLQQGQVTITVTNAPPGTLIDIAMNAGKIGEATADSSGDAVSILDLSNLGKIRVQIYVEECVDGRTILRLIAEGEVVPEDEGCRRRPFAGAWFTDEITSIVLDLQAMTISVTTTGLSTTTYAIIGAAAAAGTVGVIAATGGGDQISTGGGGVTPTSSTTTTTTSTTTTTTTTTTGGSTCSQANSTWTGTGTLTVNACMQFSSSSNIQVTCSGIGANGGNGSCSLTHTSFGVTWTYSVNATPGSVTCNIQSTTTPSADVGGTPTLSQLNVEANGTMVGIQFLTQNLGAPGECHDQYSLSLNR